MVVRIRCPKLRCSACSSAHPPVSPAVARISCGDDCFKFSRKLIDEARRWIGVLVFMSSAAFGFRRFLRRAAHRARSATAWSLPARRACAHRARSRRAPARCRPAASRSRATCRSAARIMRSTSVQPFLFQDAPARHQLRLAIAGSRRARHSSSARRRASNRAPRGSVRSPPGCRASSRLPHTSAARAARFRGCRSWCDRKLLGEFIRPHPDEPVEASAMTGVSKEEVGPSFETRSFRPLLRMRPQGKRRFRRRIRNCGVWRNPTLPALRCQGLFSYNIIRRFCDRLAVRGRRLHQLPCRFFNRPPLNQ